MNFNPDNIVFFYLTLAILGLTFAILIVFGKTEEKSTRKR
ncbi:MAG: hypothetical protein US99_C0071G0010 [Candidatus Daviesbacteria bacterium GW2011_GWF2_38_6]|uniref:Uncharacterized protein n=1 Tax=Candidatus Daviesbacteria bacterium GW2011_GWF2_38_6 TaxID=1618432 RepID=A0A0G0NH65_9BACT|nr:MAG: hypothetical protein US99_C0071G0010 [Candidatus Daviesbacteria bacterium GW2011_GWF2_38_6]